MRSTTTRAIRFVSALAVLGLTSGTALAAGDLPVAVLGIEATEGAPDAIASALTDALRQRVSATKGFRLVPGRDLVEVKLVFSCPDEAPSCMAQAGKSLGTTKLIFGAVKKSAGDTYVVTLKLLDTTRSVVDAWVAEQISRTQANGPAIRGPVQKWFSSLTGQSSAGTLRVRGDVIGASVMVDGNPAGVIGTDDIVIGGITPGRHDVTVTKDGYDLFHREINIATGATVTVEAAMQKTSTVLGATAGGADAHVSDDESGSPRLGEKIATWSVLGAGLVGVGLGIKFGIDVQSINEDLDPLRRFPCSRSTTGCDINGNPAKPLNEAQKKYVTERKAEGDRFQTYQYVAYGIGAALLGTSGYLYYRAYLAPVSATASSRSGQRLVIAPTVSPDGAGILARLKF